MNTCLINPINLTLEVLLHTGGIMSTYSASLVSPGNSCSGEGPEVTTQPHTLPQMNQKRRRFNKKRGRRQQRRAHPPHNHVIQAIAAYQLTRPKLYSIAGSTIATFSEAHVAVMHWKNEFRPRIMAEVDERKVDLLYDTGAQSSCPTMATVCQLFPAKKLQTTASRCQAARNMDLVGEAHFEVKVKGKTLTQEFIICNKINNNIMGSDLASGLELSYDAETRQLFSIAPIDNSLVAQRRVLLPAS